MIFQLLVFILLLFSPSASRHGTRRHRHTHHGVKMASSKSKFSGSGTWYTPGIGACGSTATSADYIVALNGPQYQQGGFCYKKIRITNVMNGKSVGAKVQDECPSCSYGSLDMSPVVFAAIADSGLGEGQIQISWRFLGSSKHARDSAPSDDVNITSTDPEAASGPFHNGEDAMEDQTRGPKFYMAHGH